jgi:hypothetical protein
MRIVYPIRLQFFSAKKFLNKTIIFCSLNTSARVNVLYRPMKTEIEDDLYGKLYEKSNSLNEEITFLYHEIEFLIPV